MYNVLDVTCPLCKAFIGQTCVTKSGKPFKRVGVPGLTSHVARVEAAKKAGGPNTNMTTGTPYELKTVTVTWPDPVRDDYLNEKYARLIKKRAKKKAKKGKSKSKKGKK